MCNSIDLQWLTPLGPVLDINKWREMLTRHKLTLIIRSDEKLELKEGGDNEPNGADFIEVDEH